MQRPNPMLKTTRIKSGNKLACLGRSPPESYTNECRPKFLIVKVEISMTLIRALGNCTEP